MRLVIKKNQIQTKNTINKASDFYDSDEQPENIRNVVGHYFKVAFQVYVTAKCVFEV